MLLQRLVTRIEIRQEIEPFVNVPVSVIISGLLTLLAYVVAEPFTGRPKARRRRRRWATTRCR